MNRGEFAAGVNHELATRLGITIPNTIHVRCADQAQIQVESGPRRGAKNNPYNTTLRTRNSTTLAGNTAGVQEYATPKEGMKATATTFLEEAHGYEKILRRKHRDAPAWWICVAIVESDWGTGQAFNPEDDHPLILEVLEDIRHKRTPNKLAELEARPIAS